MKHFGKPIKYIRKEKAMTQQEITELVNMHRSNYSRVEAGDRDLSLDAVNKIARYYGMTINELVNFDCKPPRMLQLKKSLLEQLKRIAELKPEEKNMVIKMVETFLTRK